MQIASHVTPTMATRRRRTSPVVPGAKRPALRQLQEGEVEQLPTTNDVCNYWPPNPAFDPKRVLLGRMFFVNDDKTKYVSVGYYPARDYQPLVEFGAFRRGGSKCLILADEQVAALAHCLPSIRDSMCVGGDRVVIKCESGNFRLHNPPEARLSQAVCGHREHKPDTTRHGQSGAIFPHHSAAIAPLY